MCDGVIKIAVQEERFTRNKHDSNFPKNAIIYCLNSSNICISDLECIVYYEKPLLTFERLLETYIGCAPRGLRSFVIAMEVWLKEKLFIKSNLQNEFKDIQKSFSKEVNYKIPKILFSQHHKSHAASAFYPSPFDEAAILCLDGVGEWATCSAWIGKDNSIRPIWEISFPHSIGLFYSAFTYYCGFKVNSGEYKLMGLAPYGKPIYVEIIKKYLIDIKEDGSFRLDISYFKYHRGFKMTSSKFHKLFGEPSRKTDKEIKQLHMDLAASIQLITEEIVLKLAKSLRKETGLTKLCLSGGVALNCVANGKLIKEKIFDDIWIQPASGDDGSSLGAAFIGWHEYFKKPRKINSDDSMKGSFLGCNFSNKEITNYLNKIKAPYQTFEDQELFEQLAKFIDEGKVIGWFNGPMEFGPRALGARSIIGDSRDQNMQRTINQKIKYRESFRPFAPSILEEYVSEYFEIDKKSPYMLFVAPIKKELRKAITAKKGKIVGFEKLNISRSLIPAVTHVDYSSRIQTVSKKTNPRFYKLIESFKNRTGYPLVVNTSFNIRGEPIVCTPQDAYRCFMRTELDILVLQNNLLFKNQQLKAEINEKWTYEMKWD